jgi:DNA ligase-3
MSDDKFALDYSKRLSKCKRCKKEIAKGDVRLAKLAANFFGGGDGSDDSEMKQYYHIECLFDTFRRAKATTKIIESSDDIQGFSAAIDADKKKIVSSIKSFFSFQN